MSTPITLMIVYTKHTILLFLYFDQFDELVDVGVETAVEGGLWSRCFGYFYLNCCLWLCLLCFLGLLILFHFDNVVQLVTVKIYWTHVGT